MKKYVKIDLEGKDIKEIHIQEFPEVRKDLEFRESFTYKTTVGDYKRNWLGFKVWKRTEKTVEVANIIVHSEENCIGTNWVLHNYPSEFYLKGEERIERDLKPGIIFTQYHTDINYMISKTPHSNDSNRYDIITLPYITLVTEYEVMTYSFMTSEELYEFIDYVGGYISTSAKIYSFDKCKVIDNFKDIIGDGK